MVLPMRFQNDNVFKGSNELPISLAFDGLVTTYPKPPTLPQLMTFLPYYFSSLHGFCDKNKMEMTKPVLN